MREMVSKKRTRLIFNIAILLKGVHAVLEISGSIAIFFISRDFVLRGISVIMQGEISEDSRDFFAQYMIQIGSHFTASSQHFVALYLLSHGLVNGFLAINLLKEKPWIFPVSFLVYGFLIAYQIFRLSIAYSPILFLFTIFDIFVVWFVWLEYRANKHEIKEEKRLDVVG